MRDYGKVSPQFWIGQTGKELKAAGHEAVIVGLYLMTSPHANMIGLYYLPVLYIAHETGLGLEGATRGLKACVEAGLCAYDEDDEVVFVPRMAAYQIAETLSVRDNRRIAVIREVESCGHTEFAELFLQAYAEPFNMDAPVYPSVPHHRFSKALTDRIVRACGGVCKGCGVSFDDEIPTIDHIIAKINGGGRDESNLQALCRQCNSRKSAKDREIFWSRAGIEVTPYKGVPKGSHKDDRPLRSQEQEQEQEQEQKGKRGDKSPQRARAREGPKPRFRADQHPLPDWLDAGTWMAWIEHRRQLRKPLTERSVAQQVVALTEWRAAGHDPASIIRTSIQNSWVGLFPPKGEKPPVDRVAAGRAAIEAAMQMAGKT